MKTKSFLSYNCILASLFWLGYVRAADSVVADLVEVVQPSEAMTAEIATPIESSSGNTLAIEAIPQADTSTSLTLDVVDSMPVAVEPVAVEPVAVEPVAVEPVAVEPVAVEPVAVEPVAVETNDADILPVIASEIIFTEEMPLLAHNSSNQLTNFTDFNTVGTEETDTAYLVDEEPVASGVDISHKYNYNVRGKSYDVFASAKKFQEIGTASWYGPGFHGKKTANGEIYNMNALTAAHKTLPLGSKVRVTNLENGNHVIVRINDRGPFHGGRIIDLSKKAAKKLNMLKKGHAKVHVKAIQ